MTTVIGSMLVLLTMSINLLLDEKQKDPPKKLTLTGKVSFKGGKGTFPAGTQVEIRLQDVSIADAPAKEISKVVIKDPKAFPIPFVLEYDPAKIKGQLRYGLSVRIVQGKKLLYINDTHIGVLTREQPTKNIDAPVIAVRQ